MFRFLKRNKSLEKVLEARAICESRNASLDEKILNANNGLEYLKEDFEWTYDLSRKLVEADFKFHHANFYFLQRQTQRGYTEHSISQFQLAIEVFREERPCLNYIWALIGIGISYLETKNEDRDLCNNVVNAFNYLKSAKEIAESIDLAETDIWMSICQHIVTTCSMPVFQNEFIAVEKAQEIYLELQPRLIKQEKNHDLVKLYAGMARTYISHAKYHPDTTHNVKSMLGSARSIALSNEMKQEFVHTIFLELDYLLSVDQLFTEDEINDALGNIGVAFQTIGEIDYLFGKLKFYQLHAVLVLRLASVSNRVKAKHLTEFLLRGLTCAEDCGSSYLAIYYFQLIDTFQRFKIPQYVLRQYNVLDLLNKIKTDPELRHSIEYHRASVILADILIDSEAGEKYQNYHKAIKLLESAIAFLQKNGAAHEIAEAKTSLANAWAMRHDPLYPDAYDNSMMLLLEVACSTEILDNPLQYRAVVNDLSCTFLKRSNGNRIENLEIAKECITIALSMTDADKEKSMFAVILANLINWFVRSNQTDKKFAQTVINESNKICNVIQLEDDNTKWIKLKMAVGEIAHYLYELDISNEVAFNDAESVYVMLLHADCLTSKPWLRVTILKMYMVLLISKLWNDEEVSYSEKLELVFNELIELTHEESLPLEQMTTLICQGYYQVSIAQWARADEYFSLAISIYNNQFYALENSDFLTFLEKRTQWQLSAIPISALLNGDKKRGILLNEQLRASGLREKISNEISSELKSLGKNSQSSPACLDFNLLNASSKKTEIDTLVNFYSSSHSWVLMPFLSLKLGVFVLIPPSYLKMEPIVSENTNLGIERFFSILGVKLNTKTKIEDGLFRALISFRETNNARELNKALTNFANELQNHIGNWIVDTLNELSNVADHNLVVLPFGPMAHTPINLIKGRGSYLIEKFKVTLCPSLYLLEQLEKRSVDGSKSLSFVGDTSAMDLPFTRVEEGACHLAFENKLNERSDFQTVEQINESLKYANYWHFACHGQLNLRNMSESHLLFGEQKFNVFEVQKLDQRRNKNLVVLSACESGVLDYTERLNEFNGFPTEFIKHGANSVIATLWPVADQITTLFFAEFYRLHIQEGNSISLAFNITQNWLKDLTIKELATYYPKLGSDPESSELIKDYCNQLSVLPAETQPYKAPAYWGAFYLYGPIRN